ncbi:MAG: gliding motility-associated C-terminal domain-containing protein [Bacteroidales bacterium]|nr:gliding motility-associated C-terminal domain-containing protein [Bacteroidales bacterium]
MVRKHHIKWIVTLILALMLMGRSSGQVIDTVCPGDRGVMYGVTGSPTSFFHWNVEGGQIVHDFGDTIVVNWGTDRGTYTISVIEESQYGCLGTEQFADVVILGGPDVDIGVDPVFCQGDSELIYAFVDGNVINYQWSTGSTSREIVVYYAGEYSIEVTDDLGCMARDTIDVTVNPLPVFSAGMDTTLCRLEGLEISADNPDYMYTWTCEEWDAIQNGQYIEVFQSHYDQVVVAEATDINNCVSTDTVIVYHCPNGLWDITNVFSPNESDNTNRTWEIHGLQYYPEAEILVFDRWGRLVFKGSGFTTDDTGWDGTDLGGRKLPMDSYHYVINFNSKDIPTITGIVTIVR